MAILSALKTAFPTLSATDRVNLLGDQFALFEAGTSTIVVVRSKTVEVLAAVRKKHATLPFILVSGSLGEGEGYAMGVRMNSPLMFDLV